MTLSRDKNFYRLICGDCLPTLKRFEENSVDCVVTDPPYGIGFMGKEWDRALPPKETFQECFRVLKPGGLAFVMSSPRQDVLWRMMAMLEEVGFELKQSFISWIYKCISEDTEILTNNGWQTIDTLDKSDLIYSFDVESSKLKQESILKIFKSKYNGEMVHIKNQSTDQLVTPNHRVLHKDNKHSGNRRFISKWEYTEANNLIAHCGINLPLSGRYDGTISIGKPLASLLGWILTEGTFYQQNRTNDIRIYQSSTNQKYVEKIEKLLKTLRVPFRKYDRTRLYKNREYIEYCFRFSGEWVNKIHSLIPNKQPTFGLLQLVYEEREALFNALIDGDGSRKGTGLCFYQADKFFLDWFQILCLTLGYKTTRNDKKWSVGISKTNTTQFQAVHFKNGFVTREQYNGRVWCIETKTSNFVAKRNDLIFITGNSGFPKAYDLSLGIDRKLIIEEFQNEHNRKPSKVKLKELMKEKRRVVGKYNPFVDGKIRQNFGVRNGNIYKRGDSGRLTSLNEGMLPLVAPYSDLAKKWDGWKSQTGLKPALECILMVNKPFSEKTVVDNVLKWGVGAINVDATRIPINPDIDDMERRVERKQRISQTWEKGSGFKNERNPITGVRKEGRFPANLIISDNALDDGRIIKSGNYRPPIARRRERYFKERSNHFGISNAPDNYGDVGSPYRYFDLDAWFKHQGFLDVPKASKSERDKGLNQFEKKVKSEKRNVEDKGGLQDRLHGKVPKRNAHPTVKPVKLMAYLVQLGCPPDGVVLDPFLGSGSTMVACVQLRKSCIGIEIDAEACNIAKHRVNQLGTLLPYTLDFKYEVV